MHNVEFYALSNSRICLVRLRSLSGTLEDSTPSNNILRALNTGLVCLIDLTNPLRSSALDASSIKVPSPTRTLNTASVSFKISRSLKITPRACNLPNESFALLRAMVKFRMYVDIAI